MTQIGFGLVPGANGVQVAPVMMLTSGGESHPEEYESNFETPEGVHVEVTFHTDNKSQSDRYADEMAQKMGWKVLQQAPEGPETLGSKIGTAWVGAVIMPVIAGFAGFLVITALHIAGYFTFNEATSNISQMVRIALLSVPLLGFLFTGVALITHGRDSSTV